MDEKTVRLTYAIQFVGDMERAVAFYRDVLGLQLKFQSPYWSEFVTGATCLALHPATPANPAGKVQLGFGVSDLAAFHDRLASGGVVFTQPPARQEGSLIARFLGPDGSEISVGEG